MENKHSERNKNNMTLLNKLPEMGFIRNRMRLKVVQKWQFIVYPLSDD